MPANIHDSGYKKLFSNRTIFRQLMERFVPPPCVTELDFNSCKTVDMSLLLNWFRQLAEHGRVPPEDYVQLDYVYRSEEEVRTMLVATLEQERKNIYAKGEADGFVRGQAVGIIKGEAAGMEVQRETILQLLQFRFNLGEAEQNRIAKELGQLQTLEQLQRLTNGLLNPASRLEDFIAQLTSYRSPNQAA